MLFTQADSFFVLALVAVGHALSRTQIIFKRWTTEVTNAFMFAGALRFARGIVWTLNIDTRMKI